MTLNLDYKVRWFGAAFVVALAAWIIHGFFVPLAWASIITIATWPPYRRFAAWMPARMGSIATPLVFTLLVSSFVLGPMVFAFAAVALQAQTWLAKLIAADQAGLAAPAWLASLPWIGSGFAERWQQFLGAPGGISTWLQRESSTLLNWAQTLGQFAIYHMFVISFTVLVMFFIYRAGDRQALRVGRLLSEAIGASGAQYLELVIRAVRVTVVGMVAVALFDGVLIGIIYAVGGVPDPGVWAAVTGLSAMIPYMAYVTVAGVAVSLAIGGSIASALSVCLLGYGVHLAADKVVRPMLVGGAMKLGFLWILMASLGGLELMGFLGVLVGPIVLALAGSIWRQCMLDRARSSRGRVAAIRTDRDTAT